jgi:hypothetical protein
MPCSTHAGFEVACRAARMPVLKQQHAHAAAMLLAAAGAAAKLATKFSV